MKIIPKETRYTIPTHFRAEMVSDTSTEPKWIYRNKLGDVVAPDTPGAIRYRRFWGFVSTEEPDFYDSIVDRTAVVEAWPLFMQQGGNVRFMHGPNPVGRIFNGDWELRAEGVYVGVSIPETETEVLEKIDANIVHAFSLGWNAVKVLWREDSPDGYLHFTKIRIAEITICDAGATPNTDIQEERTASNATQEEISLFQRFLRWMKGQNRQPAGTLPAEPQEDEMTPEQFEKMMAKLEERFTAIQGELGKIVERASKPADPPATPEAPATPEKPLDQRIAEEINAATKPLLEEIAALKRATSTEEPLSGSLTDLETQIKAFEAHVAEIAKNENMTPDQRLSFMRMVDGNPATVRGLMTTLK